MERTFASILCCGFCETQLSCGCKCSSLVVFCGDDAFIHFAVHVMPKIFLGDVSSLAQILSIFFLTHVFFMSCCVKNGTCCLKHFHIFVNCFPVF